VIRHVALFRWKPDTPPAQVDRVTEALTALRSAIPEIAGYSCGPNVGDDRNWDYAVVADFVTFDDWRVYDAHPRHEAARAGEMRPWIAERAVLQYEVA
jgi:hypothetical protein